MKRHLRLPLSLFLSLALAATATARVFPDAEQTRYSEAFAYLSEQGIVQGYPDGSARPFDLLSRAEALKLVLESQADLKAAVAALRGKLPPLPLFADVDQKGWYAPYLETAFAYGIITGYPDRTFRPANSVRVEEAITMLLRAGNDLPTDVPFASKNALENTHGQWYTNAVSQALTKNLVSSREVMRAGQMITRGQFADIVYRLHVIKRENLATFNRPEPVVATLPPPPVPRAVTAQPQPVRAPVRGPAPVASTDPTILQYASERYFSITIPSLGIRDLLITHPGDPFSSQGILAPLKSGVGHLFSYPGAGGKVLVYGHSSGYPWDVSHFTKIFRQVNRLNRGDRVYVTYNRNLYIYEVSYEEAIPASDTSRYSGNGEELILYTCWPPDSISLRYLIHAFPVKTVALR